MRVLIAALLTAATTLTSHATENPAPNCGLELHVRFIESAPRDRFVIENRSLAAIDVATVTLDLSSSAGNLIFDTIDGGDGVEVFQPFRAEKSAASLRGDPAVGDGDTSIALSFAEFKAGQSFTFSIDVDDRLTNSDLGQIRVSGGEMQGAGLVAATLDGSTHRAIFDAGNRARLTGGCT